MRVILMGLFVLGSAACGDLASFRGNGDEDATALELKGDLAKENCNKGAPAESGEEEEAGDAAEAEEAELALAKAEKADKVKADKVKADKVKTKDGTEKVKAEKTKTEKVKEKCAGTTPPTPPTDDGTTTPPTDGGTTTPPTDGGTTTPPTDGSTTTPVSYAADIEPIMSASCATASCHAGSSPAKGIGLDTKSGVESNIDASIASIVNGSMPIGSAPKVSAAEVELLRQWKAQNFPN